MKIEKVVMTVDDGGMDCIGGVHTEYEPIALRLDEDVHIVGTMDERRVRITLSGEELVKIAAILGVTII